jgi:hypothetical protein
MIAKAMSEMPVTDKFRAFFGRHSHPFFAEMIVSVMFAVMPPMVFHSAVTEKYAAKREQTQRLPEMKRRQPENIGHEGIPQPHHCCAKSGYCRKRKYYMS